MMTISLFKLEIFIPETHLDMLQTALHGVDAGHIGNYDCCLSYSRVMSTWRPLAGTNPYIGKENTVSCELHRERKYDKLRTRNKGRGHDPGRETKGNNGCNQTRSSV